MEQSTKDKIQNIIDENDVLLFMKGTPVMPQCGFLQQLWSFKPYGN